MYSDEKICHPRNNEMTLQQMDGRNKAHEDRHSVLLWAWRICLLLTVACLSTAVIFGMSTKPNRSNAPEIGMWIASLVLFVCFLILVTVWIVVRGRYLSAALHRHQTMKKDGI